VPHIPLEGAMNFRDVGGYPTVDGRRVRTGLVYRSDGLHALTEADCAVVGALGLRTVWDLRRDVERERRPSVAHTPGLEAVVIAIGDNGPVAQQAELLDMVLSGELPEADDAFMVDEYVRMLDEHAAEFGRLLGGLTEPGALPALFHCMAGKDRTGVAAAMLLLLLGVERSTVLDDYELTNEYRSNRRIAELTPQLEASGIDVEKVRPLLSARRPVLEGALDHMGDAEAFVLGPAGLSPATVARLRALLLE
jgi:protein-tyrosine phosphatase